jgi:CRISP-associated protein Cas1
MLKRTLFFSNPYHLSIRYEQLVAADKAAQKEKTVPIEDIGFIVFEHPQITFTQAVIQLLAENNTAVIFCDAKHHPNSMLLHLDTHTIQTELFAHQVKASEPLKKQLWQQTIKAKIKNQALLLDLLDREGEALHYISGQVKSGDTTGMEAFAARKYWQRLFPVDFTRDRYGIAPNPALNYGYAILRAAVARALAGSGLLATLGIHHHNRYNSYALADDIMEPYRPYVDMVVTEMLEQGLDTETLGNPEKAFLLELLGIDVMVGNNKRPLMVALSHTTASLARCFAGKTKKITYPILQ